MIPQEIIRRKRDGHDLTDDEIAAFIAGLTDGQVSEGQAAAFAMAVCLRGMSSDETVALTRAMRNSGTTLDWRDLPGPVLDKHSTGGVGDKTSLILAPLLAACGAFVPMISGRGLGHTGGTLDKLDAIPGHRSNPSPEDFARTVRDAGWAIVGASETVAPADRRLYAIRDVTATVDSLPLIVASILSKKLAAGTQALVMDVKIGRGAFMTTHAQAVELAEALVRVATGAGLPTVALLTDMDQVLGRTAGNALEVAEAIGVLTGGGDPRLRAITLELAAEALTLGGLSHDLAGGRALAERRLADGSAAESFARGIAALGGPANVLRHAFEPAPVRLAVLATSAGVVAAVDPRMLGIALIELGGGRSRPQDRIDAAVGFSEIAGIADPVGAVPLAVVHARDVAAAERAAETIGAAFRIAEAAEPPPLLRGKIS